MQQTPNSKDVLNVLRFVASGFLGKVAFTGGNMMILAGLAFHYFNAFAFTIIFFLVFPKVKFLSKNILITGVAYGLFVWCIMNLIVVPLSNIGKRSFNFENSLINAVILIICIGIPLAYMANSYYKNRALPF